MNLNSIRGPVKFQPAPLFKMADAPYARASLAGYAVGDKVWITTPGQPGIRRRGQVIAILHRFHNLIIRAENPPSIIDINPLVHGALVAKRHESERA